MRVEMDEVSVRTRKRTEIVDITELVRGFLSDVEARAGIVNVFLPHTTAGLVINELEPGLVRDIEELLERLAPEVSSYHHNRIDNNAHAHLRNVLTSSSLTVPVKNGVLLLGTWQRILMVESDGPRERRILLTYIGL